MDIPKPFDNQRKRLLVVPHATQKKDHFENEVSFFADIVSLELISVTQTQETSKAAVYHFEIVVLACAQKVD